MMIRIRSHELIYKHIDSVERNVNGLRTSDKIYAIFHEIRISDLRKKINFIPVFIYDI